MDEKNTISHRGKAVRKIVAVLKENVFPLEVTADPFYSESNMRHLRAVIGDIESGKAKLEEHALIEN